MHTTYTNNAGYRTAGTVSSITVADKPGSVRLILTYSSGTRTIELTREQANALGKMLTGEECDSWHEVGTVR